MNREDIDKLLLGEKNEALEAHAEIVSIQKDKSNVIILGQQWVDDNLVGGLNNKCLFFGSRPGNGKTYHCSNTINNLLNKELNPSDIRICRMNLEMPTSALLLREVSKILGRRPSDILKEPYSEEERPKVTAVVSSLNDKRVTNVSVPLKGDDFRYMLQKYIEKINSENPYAKKVVLVDHLHIYLSKEVIDTILLICNEFKMLDKNLSFIFYFQLNRSVEDLWRDTKEKKINPKNMLPNPTFIYQTDILQQVADMVVGMVIPQIYDLDLFVAVNKERNQHLKEHFAEDSSDNSFVRLKGRNRIYYNIMKLRMLDSFDDPRLFCEVLNPAYEEKANQIYKENTQSFNIPTFTPKFESNSTKAPVFSDSNPFETAIPESSIPQFSSLGSGGEDDPFG